MSARSLFVLFSGLISCLHVTAQIHVSPAGSDLGTGTASSPFLTINHAASVAAAGGTILLHAGTYGDEQGIAQLGTKDLVLQGDGAGVTVLRPHTVATAALLPATPGAVTPLPHRVGLTIAGSARVHVRDLTIDANATVPSSGQLAGIYVRGGADVVLDHVHVRGCRPPVYGSGRTTAVLVRGDVSTDATSVAARDVTVTGFGDAGVHALLRAELDLQECSIAGGGAATGVASQTGVLAEADAIAAVRRCRVTDCGGPAGTAVRLDGVNLGCVVDGNRIARVARGIDVRQAPAAIVPGELRANRIAGADTTIRVEGASGLTIAGNSLFPVSRFDPLPWYDDTASGNAWANNRYPVPAGTPSVAIPGGGNVDTTPAAGISELRELQRVACGGAPVAVAAADLDGDGRMDFATVDLLPGAVGLTVALWRPAGHLVAAQPFALGAAPAALAVGNFDGAPGRDLAVLTAPVPPAVTGAAVWIFANDGAGAFTLVHQHGLNGFVHPVALATAQFDAHAADDLAVVDFGAPPFVAGNARVLRNAGTGTSWTTVTLPLTFGGAATAVATGDVDGDGAADAAIAEAGGTFGRVHWLRGDGLGAFTPGPGSPFATATGARGVVIADVDRDGDVDVAATATGGSLPLQRGALHVFTNQAGTLLARPVQPLDAGPTRLRAADLDGDTLLGVVRPELLVLHPAAGDLSLLGAYEAATGFAGGGLSTLADGPADFDVTDVDADGFVDVVAAEPARGGVALLRGSATARVQTIGRGCPGTAGREPRLELRGAPGMPTQPNASLQIGLVDAFPFTVAACAAALGPAPVLAPCNYLLDAPLLLFTIVTDGSGQGSLNLPLPAVPDARGFMFCLQAGVYDLAATTSFFPELALTAGYCLRVGD